ncbi:MAG TPA: hypothetical protein VG056_15125 [Pirellulales bacterium]|jgi:hypothetical protein|nr:hypothetical protein [Pirellulales bacterium]
METLFLVCAIVGGTLVVCQFLMTVIGFAGHGADLHGGDFHVGGFDAGAGHGGDLHGGELHGGDAHGGELQHESQNANSGSPGVASHSAPTHGSQPSHGAADWFFGVLSFRTVVAAVALFGVGGKAALAAGFDPVATLAIAIGAGLAAMYAVHGLMRGLKSLDTDRTMRIERAIGQPGTVYLSIPAHHSGSGKIQLTLQNRLDELEAVTAGDRLPDGAKIKVVSIIGPGTVEVEAMV